MNATDKALREQEERMEITQLFEAKHRFIKNWRRTGSEFLDCDFERELDYLLHLATRAAVAPFVKQLTAQLNASLNMHSSPPIFPKKET